MSMLVIKIEFTQLVYWIHKQTLINRSLQGGAENNCQLIIKLLPVYVTIIDHFVISILKRVRGMGKVFRRQKLNVGKGIFVEIHLSTKMNTATYEISPQITLCTNYRFPFRNVNASHTSAVFCIRTYLFCKNNSSR